MTTFVLLAAVLLLAGVALIVIPLIRKKPVDPSPAPWAAVAAAALLVVGSTLLYMRLTTWTWGPKASDNSPQTMVATLARKLEKDPNDLDGWLMLGRSYAVLQEYPLAIRAYQRADRLAKRTNADALIGQAEALTRSDEKELEGRAGQLFEKALSLEPNSGMALFYGAAVAMRRGELPLAKARFEKLLSFNPPDNIKPLLQKQIEAIDAQMAGGGSPELAASTNSASGGSRTGNAGGGPPARDPGPRTASAAAVDPKATVRINVMLSPSMSQAATSSSPLFVFVRDPERPGPPLAVKRLDNHFPQTVELTASDSMMPGRAIAAGQKVQVVARIARSGSPVGASGDPFGESAYMVGRDGLINIVIDRVMP